MNSYYKKRLLEEDDELSTYNAKHAAEWMEMHPYGWYNSEFDKGVGDEEDAEVDEEDELTEGIIDDIKYRNDPEYQANKKKLANAKMAKKIAATNASTEKILTKQTNQKVKQSKAATTIDQEKVKQLKAQFKSMKLNDKLSMPTNDVLSMLGIPANEQQDKKQLIPQYKSLVKKYPKSMIILTSDKDKYKDSTIVGKTPDLLAITESVEVIESLPYADYEEVDTITESSPSKVSANTWKYKGYLIVKDDENYNKYYMITNENGDDVTPGHQFKSIRDAVDKIDSGVEFPYESNEVTELVEKATIPVARDWDKLFQLMDEIGIITVEDLKRLHRDFPDMDLADAIVEYRRQLGKRFKIK